MKGTHDYLVTELEEIMSLRDERRPRNKRALIPIVGEGLSWLFGTATKSDVREIKRNLKTLASNQDELIHIAEESLSILNVTRVEVKQNRHMIDVLDQSLIVLDAKFINITDSLKIHLAILNRAFQTYTQLQLVFLELKDAMDKAAAYLQSIKTQLDQLALGHLSPSVIAPGQLTNILNEIEEQIPEYLSLPEPAYAAWYYYQTLECATLVENKMFVTIVNLPLVDINANFELFKIHNIPFPYAGTKLTANYEIEAPFLAVNLKRTQYMLLTDNEARDCASPGRRFCALKAPSYPVSTAKSCIIALYTEDKRDIESYCQVTVKMRSKLPYAYYVTDGVWAIVTLKKIVFTVVCVEGDRTTVVGKPPLTYVILNMTCHAFAAELTLPPYYHRESKYKIKNSRESLFRSENIQFPDIWEPMAEIMPAGEKLEALDSIGDVSTMPLSKLKERLETLKEKAQGQPLGGHKKASMALASIIGVVLLLIGVSLAVLYKYNGLIKWVWAVWKNKSGEGEVTNANPQLSLEEAREISHSFSQYLPQAGAGPSNED